MGGSPTRVLPELEGFLGEVALSDSPVTPSALPVVGGWGGGSSTGVCPEVCRSGVAATAAAQRRGGAPYLLGHSNRINAASWNRITRLPPCASAGPLAAPSESAGPLTPLRPNWRGSLGQLLHSVAQLLGGTSSAIPPQHADTRGSVQLITVDPDEKPAPEPLWQVRWSKPPIRDISCLLPPR